jgi:signal transduction histidine kinase
MRALKSRSIRIVAFSVAVIFSLETLIPADEAQAVQQYFYAKVAPSETTVWVSPEVGRVEMASPSERFAPVVFYHIQDAHASVEAQQNIAKILETLLEQKKLDALFLEGVNGPVSSEALRPFGEKERNGIFLEALFSKGLVNGAARFLGDHPGLSVYGIEASGPYRKNLDAYRAVMQSREESQKFLDTVEVLLVRDIKKIIDLQAFQFLKMWRAQQESGHDFNPYMKFLFECSAKHLRIDWRDLSTQGDWPQLVRLFRMLNIDASPDQDSILKEIGQLKQALGADAGAEIAWLENAAADTSLQSRELQIGSATPRVMTEHIVEKASARGLPWGRYPRVRKFLAMKVFESELTAEKLFDEIQTLESQVYKALCRGNPEAGRWLAFFRDYYLLKQALSLELRREHAARFRAHFRKNWLEAYKRFLGEASLPYEDTVATVVGRVLDFYALAEAREDTFFDAIKRKMPGPLSLQNQGGRVQHFVVVAGGYHKEGLFRRVEELGIPFNLITPIFDPQGKMLPYSELLMGRYAASSTIVPAQVVVMDDAEARAMIGDDAFGNFNKTFSRIKNEVFGQDENIRSPTEGEASYPDMAGRAEVREGAREVVLSPSKLKRSEKASPSPEKLFRMFAWRKAVKFFLSAALAGVLSGCAHREFFEKTSAWTPAERAALFQGREIRLTEDELQKLVIENDYGMELSRLQYASKKAEEGLLDGTWNLEAEFNSFGLSHSQPGLGTASVKAGGIGGQLSLTVQLSYRILSKTLGQDALARGLAYRYTQKQFYLWQEQVLQRSLIAKGLWLDIERLREQHTVLENAEHYFSEKALPAAEKRAGLGTMKQEDVEKLREKTVEFQGRLGKVKAELAAKNAALLGMISGSSQDMSKQVIPVLNAPTGMGDAGISDDPEESVRRALEKPEGGSPRNRSLAAGFAGREATVIAGRLASSDQWSKLNIEAMLYSSHIDTSESEVSAALKNPFLPGAGYDRPKETQGNVAELLPLWGAATADRKIAAHAVSVAEAEIRKKTTELQVQFRTLHAELKSSRKEKGLLEEAFRKTGIYLEQSRRTDAKGRRYFSSDIELASAVERSMNQKMRILDLGCRISALEEEIKMLGGGEGFFWQEPQSPASRPEIRNQPGSDLRGSESSSQPTKRSEIREGDVSSKAMMVGIGTTGLAIATLGLVFFLQSHIQEVSWRSFFLSMAVNIVWAGLIAAYCVWMQDHLHRGWKVALSKDYWRDVQDAALPVTAFAVFFTSYYALVGMIDFAWWMNQWAEIALKTGVDIALNYFIFYPRMLWLFFKSAYKEEHRDESFEVFKARPYFDESRRKLLVLFLPIEILAMFVNKLWTPYLSEIVILSGDIAFTWVALRMIEKMYKSTLEEPEPFVEMDPTVRKKSTTEFRSEARLTPAEKLEREKFFSLIEILNSLWWLRQEPSRFHDKEFLGFDGDVPKKDIIFSWSSEEFATKKQGVHDMIQHRIAEGRLEYVHFFQLARLLDLRENVYPGHFSELEKMAVSYAKRIAHQLRNYFTVIQGWEETIFEMFQDQDQAQLRRSLGRFFTEWPEVLRKIETVQQKAKEGSPAKDVSETLLEASWVTSNVFTPENIEEGIAKLQGMGESAGMGAGAIFRKALAVIERNARYIRLYDSIHVGMAKEISQKVSLRDVLDTVVAVGRTKRGVEIVKDYGEEILATILEVQFSEIVLNLLKNAVEAAGARKTTSSPKRITLSLRASGSNFEFTIQDNGQGISPENLKKIRELTSFTTKERGHGIGLPLTLRQIAEMGGTWEVDSQVEQADREGWTKFRILLPGDVSMRSEQRVAGKVAPTEVRPSLEDPFLRTWKSSLEGLTSAHRAEVRSVYKAPIFSSARVFLGTMILWLFLAANVFAGDSKEEFKAAEKELQKVVFSIKDPSLISGYEGAVVRAIHDGLENGETAEQAVGKLYVLDTVKQMLLAPALKMEKSLYPGRAVKLLPVTDVVASKTTTQDVGEKPEDSVSGSENERDLLGKLSPKAASSAAASPANATPGIAAAGPLGAGQRAVEKILPKNPAPSSVPVPSEPALPSEGLSGASNPPEVDIQKNSPATSASEKTSEKDQREQSSDLQSFLNQRQVTSNIPRANEPAPALRSLQAKNVFDRDFKVSPLPLGEAGSIGMKAKAPFEGRVERLGDPGQKVFKGGEAIHSVVNGERLAKGEVLRKREKVLRETKRIFDADEATTVLEMAKIDQEIIKLGIERVALEQELEAGTFRPLSDIQVVQGQGGDVHTGDSVTEYIPLNRVRVQIRVPVHLMALNHFEAIVNGHSSKIIELQWGEIDPITREVPLILDLQLDGSLEHPGQPVKLHFSATDFALSQGQGSLYNDATEGPAVHVIARVRGREEISVPSPRMPGRVSFSVLDGERVSLGQTLGSVLGAQGAADLEKEAAAFDMHAQDLLKQAQEAETSGVFLATRETTDGLQTQMVEGNMARSLRAQFEMKAPQAGILAGASDMDGMGVSKGMNVARILTHRVFLGDDTGQNISSMILISEKHKIDAGHAVVIRLGDGTDLKGQVTAVRRGMTHPQADLKGFMAIEIEVMDPDYRLHPEMPVRIILPETVSPRLKEHTNQGSERPLTYAAHAVPGSLPSIVEEAFLKNPGQNPQAAVVSEHLVNSILADSNPWNRMKAFRYFSERFRTPEFYKHLCRFAIEGPKDVAIAAMDVLKQERSWIPLLQVLDTVMRRGGDRPSMFAAETAYDFLLDLLEDNSEGSGELFRLIDEEASLDPELHGRFQTFFLSVMKHEDSNSASVLRILRGPFWTDLNLAELYSGIKEQDETLALLIRDELMRRLQLQKTKGSSYGYYVDRVVYSGQPFAPIRRKLYRLENDRKNDMGFLVGSPGWKKGIHAGFSEPFLDRKAERLAAADFKSLVHRNNAGPLKQGQYDLSWFKRNGGRLGDFAQRSLQDQQAVVDKLFGQEDYPELLRILQTQEHRNQFASAIVSRMLVDPEGRFYLASLYGSTKEQALRSIIEDVQSPGRGLRSLLLADADAFSKGDILKGHYGQNSEAAVRSAYGLALLRFYAIEKNPNAKAMILSKLLVLTWHDREAYFFLHPKANSSSWVSMIFGGLQLDSRPQDAALLNRVVQFEIERRAVRTAIAMEEERYGFTDLGRRVPGREGAILESFRLQTEPERAGRFLECMTRGESLIKKLKDNSQKGSSLQEMEVVNGVLAIARDNADRICNNKRDEIGPFWIFLNPWYGFGAVLTISLALFFGIRLGKHFFWDKWRLSKDLQNYKPSLKRQQKSLEFVTTEHEEYKLQQRYGKNSVAAEQFDRMITLLEENPDELNWNQISSVISDARKLMSHSDFTYSIATLRDARSKDFYEATHAYWILSRLLLMFAERLYMQIKAGGLSHEKNVVARAQHKALIDAVIASTGLRIMIVQLENIKKAESFRAARVPHPAEKRTAEMAQYRMYRFQDALWWYVRKIFFYDHFSRQSRRIYLQHLEEDILGAANRFFAYERKNREEQSLRGLEEEDRPFFVRELLGGARRHLPSVYYPVRTVADTDGIDVENNERQLFGRFTMAVSVTTHAIFLLAILVGWFTGLSLMGTGVILLITGALTFAGYFYHILSFMKSSDASFDAMRRNRAFWMIEDLDRDEARRLRAANQPVTIHPGTSSEGPGDTGAPRSEVRRDPEAVVFHDSREKSVSISDISDTSSNGSFEAGIPETLRPKPQEKLIADPEESSSRGLVLKVDSFGSPVGTGIASPEASRPQTPEGVSSGSVALRSTPEEPSVSDELRILTAIKVTEFILRENDQALLPRLSSLLSDLRAIAERSSADLSVLLDLPLAKLVAYEGSLNAPGSPARPTNVSQMLFLDVRIGVSDEQLLLLSGLPFRVVVLFPSGQELRMRSFESKIKRLGLPPGQFQAVLAGGSASAVICEKLRLEVASPQFRAEDYAFVGTDSRDVKKVSAYVGNLVYCGKEIRSFDPEVLLSALWCLLKSPEVFRLGLAKKGPWEMKDAVMYAIEHFAESVRAINTAA